MSTDLITLSGGVPAHFQGFAGPDMNKAAQQGISAGFAVVGYKGRNWRIKHQGSEELIQFQPQGQSRPIPAPNLSVVIVGVSPYVSKQYYGKRYSEGDDAAPDCYSMNGIAPEPDSAHKQSEFCASCPMNVFGSRISENGKKAKACQDSRRIAVVPSGDIDNESYGGPMLLRVPPMSLAGLAKYGSELMRFGAQPYMVATSLSFDFDVAYPLITFTAEGFLDEEQSEMVADAMLDPIVERMLVLEMEPVGVATPEAGAAHPLAGGHPGAAPATTVAPQAAQTPPAPPQAAPQPPAAAPQPAPEPVRTVLPPHVLAAAQGMKAAGMDAAAIGTAIRAMMGSPATAPAAQVVPPAVEVAPQPPAQPPAPPKPPRVRRTAPTPTVTPGSAGAPALAIAAPAPTQVQAQAQAGSAADEAGSAAAEAGPAAATPIAQAGEDWEAMISDLGI